MKKSILIFDHGKCVGEMDVSSPLEGGAIMEIIDGIKENGEKIHILRLVKMDYGIVIPNESARFWRSLELAGVASQELKMRSAAKNN